MQRSRSSMVARFVMVLCVGERSAALFLSIMERILTSQITRVEEPARGPRAAACTWPARVRARGSRLSIRDISYY
eukprot:COSAG02_NODE_35_length_49339_cov_20.375102_45_plen_75_part_00